MTSQNGLANRVAQNGAAPGTGSVVNLTDIIPGCQSFAQAFGPGGKCYYVMEDGTNWEVGSGTITPGTPDQLSRDTVSDNSQGTTSRLNFSTPVRIINDLPAQLWVTMDAVRQAMLAAPDFKEMDLTDGVPVLVNRNGMDRLPLVTSPKTDAQAGITSMVMSQDKSAVKVIDSTGQPHNLPTQDGLSGAYLTTDNYTKMTLDTSSNQPVLIDKGGARVVLATTGYVNTHRGDQVSKDDILYLQNQINELRTHNGQQDDRITSDETVVKQHDDLLKYYTQALKNHGIIQ